MTIIELSDFTGKNRTTVERWCAKCISSSILNKVQNAQKGKPADFSMEEVGEILSSGSMSKDAVNIIMENARKKGLTVQAQAVDYEIIGKMIGMAVSAAMTPIVQELRQINSSSQLQIEQPKQDYFSLIAYTSLNKIKINSSELRKMGMDLRKMAISQGKELHKIPDERYGSVNSYPIEILDEYFSE